MYMIVNQTDLSVGSLNQSYLIFAAEYYADSSFCELAALPLCVCFNVKSRTLGR